jgi:hypothetical protein
VSTSRVRQNAGVDRRGVAWTARVLANAATECVVLAILAGIFVERGDQLRRFFKGLIHSLCGFLGVWVRSAID